MTATTTVGHRARSDACNVCVSRPEGAARTQNSQHHAEDGHTGRDGPRRDGLGTPCDAARLTVLRASQQQECIPPLHPDLQEQSPPDSQPASQQASKQSTAALEEGVPVSLGPPGDGGKRSAQPPVLAADTKSAGRSARGIPSFGEAVGDQIRARTTTD